MVLFTILFFALLRVGKEGDKCIEQYLKDRHKRDESKH